MYSVMVKTKSRPRSEQFRDYQQPSETQLDRIESKLDFIIRWVESQG